MRKLAYSSKQRRGEEERRNESPIGILVVDLSVDVVGTEGDHLSALFISSKLTRPFCKDSNGETMCKY